MKRDPRLVRLSRDHQRALALALYIDRELAADGEDAVASLRSEVDSFSEMSLLPHFRAECECLLARLVRHVADGDELITRTQGDHLRVEALLARLRDVEDGSEHRMMLADLAEVLRTHIRWEEAVLFEATQARFDEGELRALGKDLSERLPEIPPAPGWMGRLNP